MKPSITRFVDEYLIDYNGAEAARRAGYAAASAKQQAYVLLRRDEVITAIATRHAEYRAQLGMQADEIITRLSQLARSATGEWQQLRALGMLMRHLGMFTPAKTPLRPTRYRGLYRPPPLDPDEPEPQAPATPTAAAPAADPDQDDPDPAQTPPDRGDPEPPEPPAQTPPDQGDPEPVPVGPVPVGPVPVGPVPVGPVPRRRNQGRPKPSPGPTGTSPPPRPPPDYNRIIAANNEARARIRILANRRKHFSDDG